VLPPHVAMRRSSNHPLPIPNSLYAVVATVPLGFEVQWEAHHCWWAFRTEVKGVTGGVVKTQSPAAPQIAHD